MIATRARSLAILSALAGVALALEPGAAKEAAARVDVKRAQASVEAFCAPELMGRKTGTVGAKKTTALIARCFEEAGLAKLEGTSSYVVTGEGGDEDVVGRIPGSDRAAEAIVVSAHWDSLGEDETGKLVPGADENGSGLAALLETARALAKAKPRRTLVFASFGGWWDMNDAKRFRGAKDFLKLKKVQPIFQVDLMMLGVPLLPSEPERFFALGTESSPALADVLKQSAAQESELRVARASADLVEKRGPRDDYDAFRAAGVPFVFLTSGVSRFYHKVGDVPATVDPKRIAAAARLAIQLVAHVDALDVAPSFAKETTHDDRADATEVLGLIEAALGDKSGIALEARDRKALSFKRDRIKDLLEPTGDLHLEPRDRGILKDSLELLLLALTK